MRSLPVLLAALLLAGCATTSSLPVPVGEQVPQQLDRDEQTASYLLYLPPAYAESDEPWPLLLFLHGAGERGDDLERVKVHGPPKLLAAGQEMPFIVASPQAPAEQWWSVDVLDALLDDLADRYRVDPNRVYVTGLSMGGFGTWALATAYPDRFAAIAPICGGGEAEQACTLRDTPTWVFHGAQDTVVPLERSQVMVDALRTCDGFVHFTVYPDAGHDSWTATYDNPRLYQWLLSHRRVEGRAATGE